MDFIQIGLDGRYGFHTSSLVCNTEDWISKDIHIQKEVGFHRSTWSGPHI